MKNGYEKLFIEVDPHTHSVVSSHAVSTLNDHIGKIKALGMKGLALTNHGPSYGDGGNALYFSSLKSFPEKICGTDFYRGAEADIIGYSGEADIDNVTLSGLDWVIASIHKRCLPQAMPSLITSAYIKAISNPFIHCLGHIGQAKFLCNFEKVVKTVKEYDKVIEINNSSLAGMRKGANELCFEVARLCKKYEVKVVVSSDAHSSVRTGDFTLAKELLENADFPIDLILNVKNDEFKDYIKKRKNIK